MKDIEIFSLTDSIETLQWALDTLATAAAQRRARALKLTDVPGPSVMPRLINVADLQAEINYLTAEKEARDVSAANHH